MKKAALLFSFLIFNLSFFILPKASAGWYTSLLVKSPETITSCVSGGGSIIYAGGTYGSVYSVDTSSSLPVMNYITNLSGEINDMSYVNGIIYAVNENLWRLDPASGFSVEIITNSCSFSSLIVSGDKFYMPDEYGRLWRYDSQSGKRQLIGTSALGMTDAVLYGGDVFATSRDGCLYRFHETGGSWTKEKIVNTGTKLYTLAVSTFSGSERLYAGGADSYLREIYYYKGDWKIFPVDYTSGGLTGIVPEALRSEEALLAFTDGGQIFEFSNSTSGYKKSEALDYGSAVEAGIFLGGGFYFFTSDGYMSVLSYSSAPLAGETLVHSPSSQVAAGSSTSTYRYPLFPKKDENIYFYLTDSDKSAVLSPSLYWKASSSSSWQTQALGYTGTGTGYSVYRAVLNPGVSTGTVIDYYLYSDGVYVFRPGEDKLSSNSSYGFGYSSAVAGAKPFTFMVAGEGNCFHCVKDSFGAYASMRMPLYPVSGDEVTFFIGNQASGSGNYGNMNGGAFHYYEGGRWKSEYISWSEDIGDYKYWKAVLTPSSTIYYFSVTYDDHNTTYVYGSDDESFVSDRESDARAEPFTLTFSTTSTLINLSENPSGKLNIKIYGKGTYEKAYESDISSFVRVSVPSGEYDLIISGGGYDTIYDDIVFPSADQNYTLTQSATPHTLTLAGSCEADFSANERICEDSHSDSKWGSKNEIYDLYTTYDDSNLYIGLKGILGNNSITVYLDCGDYYGSISDASALPWSTARNHGFQNGFYPDYQFIFWDFTSGSFYRITSSTTLEDATSQVSQKIKSGGYNNVGEIELKIPFNVLYGGVASTGVPSGAQLGIAAAVAGGDGTSAKDAAPDQSSSFGDTFEKFTFDKWYVVPLDGNGDGFADSGKVISEVVYSTSGVAAASSAGLESAITYENFTPSKYFYESRDMPVYIYSPDAVSAEMNWKTSAGGAYSSLQPVSQSASTFTFTIPSADVYGSLDYYFVLSKGTDTVTTPVYGITVNPEVKLAAGSKVYSVGPAEIVFSVPLQYDAQFTFLDPDSLISDGLLPANSEIVSTGGVKVPVELYELSGNIPPATLTLPYFDETDENNYAAYFYDGSRWIFKAASPDTSNNKITFSVAQQGKIGIFQLGSPTAAGSSQNISSISKPVFNPSMGEKAEFNFVVAPVSLKFEIFDLNGRKIKSVSGSSSWDGTDRNGSIVCSGAYVYHLKTGAQDFWGMLGVWK